MERDQNGESFMSIVCTLVCIYARGLHKQITRTFFSFREVKSVS